MRHNTRSAWPGSPATWRLVRTRKCGERSGAHRRITRGERHRHPSATLRLLSLPLRNPIKLLKLPRIALRRHPWAWRRTLTGYLGDAAPRSLGILLAHHEHTTQKIIMSTNTRHKLMTCVNVLLFLYS